MRSAALKIDHEASSERIGRRLTDWFVD